MRRLPLPFVLLILILSQAPGLSQAGIAKKAGNLPVQDNRGQLKAGYGQLFVPSGGRPNPANPDAVIICLVDRLAPQFCGLYEKYYSNVAKIQITDAIDFTVGYIREQLYSDLIQLKETSISTSSPLVIISGHGSDGDILLGDSVDSNAPRLSMLNIYKAVAAVAGQAKTSLNLIFDLCDAGSGITSISDYLEALAWLKPVQYDYYAILVPTVLSTSSQGGTASDIGFPQVIGNLGKTLGSGDSGDISFAQGFLASSNPGYSSACHKNGCDQWDAVPSIELIYAMADAYDQAPLIPSDPGILYAPPLGKVTWTATTVNRAPAPTSPALVH